MATWSFVSPPFVPSTVIGMVLGGLGGLTMQHILLLTSEPLFLFLRDLHKIREMMIKNRATTKSTGKAIMGLGFELRKAMLNVVSGRLEKDSFRVDSELRNGISAMAAFTLSSKIKFGRSLKSSRHVGSRVIEPVIASRLNILPKHSG